MCDFCDGKEKEIEVGSMDFFIDADMDLGVRCEAAYSYYGGESYLEINYCPMCGRKLREEQ